MNFASRPVRMLIVAVMMVIGTLAPAMACAPDTPAALDRMSAMSMDEHHPDVPPRCDFACAACLVQPAPVRLAVTTSWSSAAFAIVADRLEPVATEPDLPPPRWAMS